MKILKRPRDHKHKYYGFDPFKSGWHAQNHNKVLRANRYPLNKYPDPIQRLNYETREMQDFYPYKFKRPPIRMPTQLKVWDQDFPLAADGSRDIPLRLYGLRQYPRFAAWTPTLEQAGRHPKTKAKNYMKQIVRESLRIQTEEQLRQMEAFDIRFRHMSQTFRNEAREHYNKTGETVRMGNQPKYIKQLKELQEKYPMALGGGTIRGMTQDDDPITTRTGTKIHRASHSSSSDGARSSKISNTNVGDRTDHARGNFVPQRMPTGAGNIAPPEIPFNTGTQIDPGPIPAHGPIGGGDIAPPINALTNWQGADVGPNGWPMYIGGYPVMPRNLTFSFLDVDQNDSRYNRAKEYNRNNPNFYHPDYYRMYT